MRNTFWKQWFIAIIGEIYSFVWNKTSYLHFSAAEQISLHYKKKNNIVLQDALSAVDAAKTILQNNMV